MLAAWYAQRGDCQHPLYLKHKAAVEGRLHALHDQRTKWKSVLQLLVIIGVLFSILLISARVAKASYSVASWYGPGLYGNRLGCGGRLTTGTVGVAHRYLRCGTRLTVCYRRRCSRATVVDRGPYVYGRDFDLTARLAWRLRFTGVHSIYWRYGW
jgi:rare lipoprotein A (peptidoglycan hydrolase)